LPAILAVPAIGLEAPVLQSLGDSVLNEAVGHDPASVWPGSKGISILLAHDASHFSGLGAVHAGNRVSNLSARWRAPGPGSTDFT
jgi:sortase (surface protein transpeptidase)